MLTTAAVKAARAQSRAYKLGDAGGLYLHVATTNTKSWRLKCRIADREQLLTLGRFPATSLADARQRRDQAREAIARGEDPRAAERAARATTFAAVAADWIATRRRRWSEVHAADVETSLARDILPAIGDMPIASIDAAAVLAALRVVEARGAVETARRLRQRVSAVFKFAIVRDLASADPAAIVRDEVQLATPTQQQLAIIDVVEARRLFDHVADAGDMTALASSFLALTAVRLAAVRGARWEEIEGVDWSDAAAGPGQPVWRVPAARMKLALAKKNDARFDHVVPLSRQAVEILRAARAASGQGGLIFAGRGGAGPIGEGAIGARYIAAGFGGRHVPHGWRATFATILNDRHPADRAAIDQALAHAAKDKVEAAYNRSQQLSRRRWLFQAWADLVAPDAMTLRRR